MPKRKNKKSLEERFEEIDDEILAKKQADVKNVNTLKSDEKCERILLNYLAAKHKNLDMNYWEWTPDILNDILSKFWFAAQNEEGDYYRVSTL